MITFYSVLIAGMAILIVFELLLVNIDKTLDEIMRDIKEIKETLGNTNR